MLPQLWKSRKEGVEPLFKFRTGIDRLFESFFDDAWTTGLVTRAPEGVYFPPVDLRETEEAVLVEAELPGVEGKDVAVQVVGDHLSIRGERRQESEQRTKAYHRRECSYGTFERQIPLPPGVDRDRIEAGFSNGVLQVTLPKLPGNKPKSVAVKVKT